MTRRRKVSVIGAGNVGATIAQGILMKELADAVLFDVQGGLAKGKALDLLQSLPVDGQSVTITGSSNYQDTADSDIVVVTAGMARKPGMSREDLVTANAQIVRDVVKSAVQYSPDAHLIVVTNPLDVMCYVALEASLFPPHRVYGQSGMLDTARFRALLATELGISVEDVSSCVLGGHGDEMLPLVRYTCAGSIPVERLLPREKLADLVERTRNGGAEIVSLLQHGSAYYAPAAATVKMIEAVLKDKKQIVSSSVYLQGEYGIDDLFVGVPVILGGMGVERIIELDLTEEEQLDFMKSVGLVRKSLAAAKQVLQT